MIYYSWKSVLLHAKSDRKILEFFKEICSGKPSTLLKLWVQRALMSTSSRSNYLINPIPLIYARGISDYHKVEYIALASLRDHKRLVLYNEKHLDLRAISDPELLNAVHSNPLLTVNDNKIYFKYEEN